MVHATKVVRIRLKHDRKFAGWAAKANHASRYVYNRAVSTYLFGGDYLDRVVVDLPDDPKHFRLPGGEDDMVVGVLATQDGHWHSYRFGPSERAMKYGMFKELTGWRAELDWLRDLPLAYGRGAVLDASVAYRRVVEDNSDHPPYRPKDGRIILSSVAPPIRKGNCLVFVAGYGPVETVTPVDPSWNMRSFRIVDITHKATRRTTPADRKYELHIAVRVEAELHRPTGVVRGVDVGGRHLAATADTAGRTAVHDVRHGGMLREIDALKSLRDRRNKGSRSWSKINKKIRRLRAKAYSLANDAVNQTVARVTAGVDAVAVESLSIKGMTAHGGNRKRAINRSMRESRVGEFLCKLGARCPMRGVDLVEVPARNTSRTCHACGHVDPESRVSRGRFICTNCHREFHADVNAAWNVLHRAAGIVVLRRPEPPWGDKPKLRMLPAVPAAGAPRKGMARADGVHLCI